MLPEDPNMLLSLINMKLRDYYGSLSQLCEDMDVSESEIVGKLNRIGYRYEEEQNRFV